MKRFWLYPKEMAMNNTRIGVKEHGTKHENKLEARSVDFDVE